MLSLFALLGLEVVGAALTSPVLSVTTVRLRGAAALPAAESATVRTCAGLPAGTNWFRAPAGDIRARLGALPFLSGVEVYRRFPDELDVLVAPRRPVVQIESGGVRMEMDTIGVPIRTVRPEMAGRLRLVAMDVAVPLIPGIAVGDSVVRAAIGVYAEAPRPPVSRIGKIEVDFAGDLCLNMSDGIVIRVGRPDGIADKLAVIEKIYAREPNIARLVTSIDVTSPTNPACEPRVAQAADGRSSIDGTATTSSSAGARDATGAVSSGIGLPSARSGGHPRQ